MDWIQPDTIERTLRTEASGIAAALGHRMTSWLPHPGETQTFVSRCVVCCESMTIAVRRLRAAPIAGAATQLRCRKPSAK